MEDGGPRFIPLSWWIPKEEWSSELVEQRRATRLRPGCQALHRVFKKMTGSNHQQSKGDGSVEHREPVKILCTVCGALFGWCPGGEKCQGHTKACPGCSFGSYLGRNSFELPKVMRDELPEVVQASIRKTAALAVRQVTEA